jgi:tRNA(Arg) A34 adenosine deaminase TadA
MENYRRALLTNFYIGQAQLALDTLETPVGCVFVHNGEVIGRGMNDTNKSLNVSMIYRSR